MTAILDLQQRLLDAELDLFSAITEGHAAVEAFSERWQDLLGQVLTGIEMSTLDEETMSIAHAVSSRIELCASSFEDFFTVADTMEASMYGELDDVFAGLILEDSDKGGSEGPSQGPSFPSRNSSSTSMLPTLPSPLSSRAPSLLSDNTSDSSDDEFSIYSCRKRVSEDVWDGASTKRARTLHWVSSDDPEAYAHSDMSGPWDPLPLCQIAREERPLPVRRASSMPSVPTFSPGRKRRMSFDDIPAPKRPRGHPDVHAVSNPLANEDVFGELALNFDEWALGFDTMIATYNPPDTSQPLVLECPTMCHRSVAEEWANLLTIGPDTALSQTFEGTEGAPESFCPIDVHANSSSNEADPSTAGCHFTDMIESRTSATFDWPLSEATEEIQLTISPCTLPASLASSSDSITQSNGVPVGLESRSVNGARCAINTRAHRAQHNPSASYSPMEAPPPPFENVIADSPPGLDPPGYTVFDENPPIGSYAPPPPYCHSSENMNSAMLGGADICRTEFLPAGFEMKCRFPKTLPERAPFMQASLAIAV